MAKTTKSRGTKKPKPKATRPPRLQLAMPLFATEEGPAGLLVVAAWARLFPEQPPLVVERAGGTDTYRIGERSVNVGRLPLPVPTAEVVNAADISGMWEGSTDAVRDHASHAIVASVDEDRVRAAWDVSRVSAAMLEAGAGVALYWGASRQAHPPDVVLDLACVDAPAPVPLWVGVTVSREQPGRHSMATHGLEAFGHLEFEVLDSTMDLGELRTTMLNLALYVLENGPVLRDGDTFGPTADERWAIRHRKSKLVPKRRAIVLGIA